MHTHPNELKIVPSIDDLQSLHKYKEEYNSKHGTKINPIELIVGTKRLGTQYNILMLQEPKGIRAEPSDCRKLFYYNILGLTYDETAHSISLGEYPFVPEEKLLRTLFGKRGTSVLEDFEFRFEHN